MKPFELRPLDWETLVGVYRDHITPEFPPAERKPLKSMEKLMAARQYDPLGMYRGEELLAYSMLWHDTASGFVLLDYLAVCRNQPRGTGLGSALLALLAEQYSQHKGILVEAEAEETGAPPRERALRAQRLAFYRRAGFRDLRYIARIFGVRYAMLILGGGSETDAMEAHQRLYRDSFSLLRYWWFIQIPFERKSRQAAPKKEVLP